MKRIGLILGFGMVLCTNALAHGHWHGCFWPGLSLGVGLGPLFSCSFDCSCWCPPYYCYASPSYGYAYAQPSYVYDSTPSYARLVNNAPTLFSAQGNGTEVSAPREWVPSSPGTGKWVPDPTPYIYAPPFRPRRVTPARTGQTVTATRNVDGIPVYTITP